MKNYMFEHETWLPRPGEEVFAFFSEAGNLNSVTPLWLKFKINTPLPIKMEKGTIIDYRLILHHVSIKWKTEITAWDPPHRFVDTQVKGPYQFWVHEHLFRARDSGTFMVDRVEYRPPGWILSSLVNRLFVKKDVERIFAYRQQQFAKIFS